MTEKYALISNQKKIPYHTAKHKSYSFFKKTVIKRINPEWKRLISYSPTLEEVLGSDEFNKEMKFVKYKNEIMVRGLRKYERKLFDRMVGLYIKVNKLMER
jgi:hypothetical protein